MFDSRSIDTDKKTVQDQPTWNSIRAAKADQIVEWPGFWLHTYGHYAVALDQLTAELSGLDDSIGD